MKTKLMAGGGRSKAKGDRRTSGEREVRPTGIVTFHEYSFDLKRRELTHRGASVHLEPRVAELLALLISNAGELISRDALHSSLWPDGDGTDTALNYLVSSARRALSGAPGRPISMIRGRGYRFESAITSSARAPEPAPIYDRSAELQELRRLATSCLATKSTRFALIMGVAGIGKTRLTEQVSSEWSERGLRSVVGLCLEGQGSPPLWPWQCILRELGTRHSPPQVGPTLGADPPVSVADRYAYYLTVREALEEAARQAPLLIVLENLQLADDATLTLLQFLVSSPRPQPILYVATSRTPLVPPNERAIEALMRHGGVVSPGPLGNQGSLRLLRSVLGESGDTDLESEVLRQAGGNPLFVRGLALGLKARPDRAFELLQADEPSAMRDSIRWHLSALDERTQRLLSVAAILGEEFDVHRLSASLGVEATKVLAELATPVRLAIIRPVSQFSFVFCHALFRQYLYDSIPEVDRRGYHWQLGTVMLTDGQEAIERGLSQIAHHLALGAIEGKQAAEAAALGRQSADACIERFAFQTAATEYQRTLRLAEVGNVPISDRIGLLIRSGDCHRFLGRPEEARGFANEAATLARTHHDLAGLAEALIARVRNEFEVVDESPALVHELLSLLESIPTPSHRVRARLLAQTAIALSFTSQVARRRAACREALALAERADPRTRAFVLTARARVHWGILCDKLLWPAWVEQALDAARAANEPELELECMWLQVVHSIECASLDLANRRVELANALAERLGNALIPFFDQVVHSCFSIFRGDTNAADRCLEVRERGNELRLGFTEHVYQGQMLILAYDSDQVDKVIQQVSAVALTLPGNPIFQAFLGLGWAMLGEPERAREAFDALLAREAPFGDNNATLAVLTAAIETCAYLGDLDRADALHNELAPFADRLALTGAATTVAGIPSYALARLAAMRGDREGALRYAGMARELATRFGATRWIARADAIAERIRSGGEFVGWPPRALTA